MKKFFLAALGLAAVLPISAKTVTFMGELSIYKATDPNEEVVVVPVTWKGRTVYADGIQMFMGDGSRESSQGGFLIKNATKSVTGADGTTTKEPNPVRVQFYADKGVTIKKITFETFAGNAPFELRNDVGNGTISGETVDGIFTTQVWNGEFVGQNKTTEFIKFGLKTETNSESTRIKRITVEYDGEQQRCHMPVPNIGTDYVTDKAITFTNPEPNGKILYSLSRKATYENGPTTDADKDYIEWDGSPIILTEPTYLSAYVVAPDKDKSALYWQWIFPAPEEAHLATFDFTKPEDLTISENSPRPISYITVDPTNEASQTQYPNGTYYTENGITAEIMSNITGNTTNTIRYMATSTYGYHMQMRFAAFNKDKNNKGRFGIKVENPDNQICGVIFVWTKGSFGAAQKAYTWDKGATKPTEGDYKFPDIVDFEKEDADNYKTKIVKSYNLEDALPYLSHWEPSEDYYATEDYETNSIKNVVFEQYHASDVVQLLRAHVFYYGEAPEGSGVKNLVADDDANAPVEYYNLHGIKVANPENGIFIRRQGSKVTKVAIK